MPADDDLEAAKGDSLEADSLQEEIHLDPDLLVVHNPELVGSTPAERLQEANAVLAGEHAIQAKQNTLWRRLVFWGVAGLVAIVSLSNVCLIFWYISKTPSPSSTVLSTWSIGSVAQVIGLLVVITRHMFPGSGDSKS